MRRQGLDRPTLGAVLGVLLVFTGGCSSVQVTNTPLPVQVTNTPLPVVVLGGQPVNVFNTVSSEGNQVDNHVFTIPAGKRFVIEYVSARGVVPAADSVFGLQINIPVVHAFAVAAQGTNASGSRVFTAAQSLHTTVGPFPGATNVVVRMERSMFGAGNGATLLVTLAGQLLDP